MELGTHWSDRKFKPMNFSAMGAPITGGSLHPLLKVSFTTLTTDLTLLSCAPCPGPS
jgi:hypothetical protein